jgi:hypothetical protein
MVVARPQVAAYVLEAHERLLEDVRGQIVTNYEDRVKGTVRLLTAGNTEPTKEARRGAAG